jgi:hypothetical protein
MPPPLFWSLVIDRSVNTTLRTYYVIAGIFEVNLYLQATRHDYRISYQFGPFLVKFPIG